MRYPASLIVGFCLLTACSPPATGNEPKAPDPIVIQKLEEIIKIKERIVETANLEQELGRGDAYHEAFIELAEAKIELASEKGDRESIIAELKTIVTIRQQHLDRGLALADEVRRSQTQIADFRIKLLEAEIRLHRAKEKYGIK